MENVKTKAVRTRNYRKFYYLLQQMPGGVPAEELKETWVSEFTDNRTTHVQEMKDAEFALMMGAMEAHIHSGGAEVARMNKYRKRVIAAIGAWLRSRCKKENIATIKAIACRAAKADKFNDIPASKLRALYEEWKNKKAVSVEVNAVVGEIEFELTMNN